jgi:hypothetical protein
MQQVTLLTQSDNVSNTLDSWNQERTLEQLQRYVQSKLEYNTEDIDIVE